MSDLVAVAEATWELPASARPDMRVPARLFADEEMLGALVESMAQAAKLGDEEARACYLGSGPLNDMRSLVRHPEALRSYRDNAKGMIEAGVRSGDWRVVDLLQRAYEPGAQSLLAGLVGADPVQHYRYLKLYRLGDVEQLTGYSRPTIWRAIRSGALRAYGSGRMTRIDETDLRAWLEAGAPTGRRAA